MFYFDVIFNLSNNLKSLCVANSILGHGICRGRRGYRSALSLQVEDSWSYPSVGYYSYVMQLNSLDVYGLGFSFLRFAIKFSLCLWVRSLTVARVALSCLRNLLTKSGDSASGKWKYKSTVSKVSSKTLCWFSALNWYPTSPNTHGLLHWIRIRS